MDRRDFLRAGAGVLAAQSFGALRAVRIEVGEAAERIPADFLGFGYEISSVARPGLLSPQNRVYTQLIRTLAPAGVLRVGGNTSDYASYSATGEAAAKPKGTVVNRRALEELGGFCRATGWRLIWGLNLGEGSPEQAVEEARAVTEALGGSLLAFEIGNEPDLFVGEGHRKAPYTAVDYLREYAKYKAAIRAKLPQALFAGPDAAVKGEFVSRFAEAEAGDLQLLTHHYYRGQQGPGSTYDLLLRPDPGLAAMLGQMQRARMAAHGLPYRICETNSFSGGGRPGVSGTFGAALWVLDYCWMLASHGAGGLNLQTGVNHLGFVSSYSSVADENPDKPQVRPEYCGLLAFAQGAPGSRRLNVRADTGGLNLTAYASSREGGILVTIVNKDSSEAAVEVTAKNRVRTASALRLAAPSLQSTAGVTLGGAEVQADGRWSPKEAERIAVSGGKAGLRVPPFSAAVLKVETAS